jgi:hypothetical protein
LLGLADEQVNVVGHHHIADHDKEVALPRFQNLQNGSRPRGSLPRLAMVSNCKSEMEIVMAVIALQAFRHSLTVKGESRIDARKASQNPEGFTFGNAHPLEKTQRMGHPRTPTSNAFSTAFHNKSSIPVTNNLY